MAMFTAYFDASGSPDGTSQLFVSGFVASVEKWLRWETEWAELLAEHRIRGPFHMKEFAPGVGQYESWKDDKARRAAFMAAAIQIIKRRTNKSFSCGVVIRDLAEAKRQYVLPKYMAYPYPLCAMTVIKDVIDWVARQVDRGRRNDSIKFVFEKGDKHSGILSEELDRLGFRVTPVFLPKDEGPPFQAADILAWEHARATRDSMNLTRQFTLRGSMEAIIRKFSGREAWGFHDLKSLVEYCEVRGFARRDA